LRNKVKGYKRTFHVQKLSFRNTKQIEIVLFEMLNFCEENERSEQPGERSEQLILTPICL